jgi:peptide/nickel transport system permease protein
MEGSPDNGAASEPVSLRRYAAERIVASIVVLWLAASFVFVLFYVVPVDPAKQIAGKGAEPELVERVRHALHLDKPLVEQYGLFLKRVVLHGDLGHSYFNGETVRTIVEYAAPATGSLVGGALVFALLIGIPLGIAWARRPRLVEPAGRVFVYLGVGLMPIWVGLGLSWFFGFELRHFAIHTPIWGYADFFNPSPGEPGGPLQWAYHLILPSITLGLPIAAIYARIVRGLAAEVSRAEDKSIERRAAVIALARRLILDASWLMGATLLVENVFSIPGLGHAASRSLQNYDGPTIQGVLLFVAFLQVSIYLVGNLVGAAISKDWRRT